MWRVRRGVALFLALFVSHSLPLPLSLAGFGGVWQGRDLNIFRKIYNKEIGRKTTLYEIHSLDSGIKEVPSQGVEGEEGCGEDGIFTLEGCCCKIPFEYGGKCRILSSPLCFIITLKPRVE